MTTYPAPTPAPPPPMPTPAIRPEPQYPALSQSQDIQGNLLAAFNKDQELFVFLQLPDQPRGQAFLTDLLPLVSTNADVAAFNQAFSTARRVSGQDPDDLSATWLSVSITSHGLGLLSPAGAGILNQAGWDGGVGRFIAGATTAPDIAAAGSEAPPNWLFGRSDQTIDVVVILAADSGEDLLGVAQTLHEVAARHDALVVFEQEGRTLPGARHGHEHFGFKDGISQPGVIGFDEPDPNNPGQVLGKPGTQLIEAGEFVLGYPGHGNPGRVVPSWLFDGSFFVIRRLGQDVPGWWAQAEQVTTQLGISSEAAGAKLVGRWRSGVPLAVDPANDPRSGPDVSSDNAFDFATDLSGASTPLCAHIRKVNPRAGTTPGQDEVSKHRILRRGIPFGAPFDPAAGKDHGPDTARGLIFACYQASIAEQFEFIQQAWADAPGFPTDGAGPDPVIGPVGSGAIPLPAGPQTVALGRFVKIEGAMYAFTPSIPTLKLLASGGQLPQP